MITAWALVAIVILSTVGADVLQTIEMKRRSQAGVAETAASIVQRPLLLLSVACMAISFFSFVAAVRIADFSFVVPATAGSFVLETLLARYILRERVDARRWLGALLVAGGVALLAV